jgi:hypothetical protein
MEYMPQGIHVYFVHFWIWLTLFIVVIVSQDEEQTEFIFFPDDFPFENIFLNKTAPLIIVLCEALWRVASIPRSHQ